MKKNSVQSIGISRSVQIAQQRTGDIHPADARADDFASWRELAGA